MGNEEKRKGLFGAFQGLVDTVKTTVQDVKIPEIKLPDVKLPEVKLPQINIPGIFRGQTETQPSQPVKQPIRSISIHCALRIIYYMMTVDGVIQEEEEKKFTEIGKELAPDFDAIKGGIITACREQMTKVIDPEDYYAVLQDGVEEAVEIGKNPKDGGLAPKVLVWDLLTLAYSDGGYDENERKLLKYVVRKFDVDKTVFLELESSYLALMDLENELNWIKTTDRPYLTIEAIVNELADRKTVIFDSVKDLIAL